MRNLLGMIIGAAIDRRDGDSGIKGALVGSIAQRALKHAVPLAATAAIGWAALQLVRKIAEVDRHDLDSPGPSAQDIQVG
jgi:hypothetical protein